jgi:Mrp family chromosome partitioning ATPase
MSDAAMNSKLARFVKRMDGGDLYVAFVEALRRSAGATGESGNTTVVTSATGREGKTHVALSLAVQAASVDRRRTLVVDAAVQRRGCATRILSRRQSASDAKPADERCTATPLPLVDMLTWGPRVAAPDTNGHAAHASLADVLRELRPKYDLVVIDTISMSDGPSALGLLRCADRILFVVEHRRRSVGQIKSYVARIDSPRVLGVVLNKRRYPVPRVIYDRL